MRNISPGRILLFSFLVRAILSAVIELNNDEVYYWTYAQKLQWNYFDHPPGIAVLLKIFTLNLHFQHEFFLRLGSITCAAVSTWLIYCIGKKIKNAFTGFIAAVLFTASPYCSIIAGLLVIPDAPQLVCWLASIYLMLVIIDAGRQGQGTGGKLLLLGLTAGACMLCKVHGVFLWVGFLIYIVAYQRSLLRSGFLYLAAGITAAVFSPVIFWNLSNNFISYRYHSNRVSFFSTVQPDSFFRELAGEIGYNNPIIVVVIVLAVIAIIKNRLLVPQPSRRLLLLAALPMIGLVLFMSVFRDTLPHWTGPAYATLIPLAAAYLSSLQLKTSYAWPAAAKWSLGIILVLLIPAVVAVKWLPYHTGSNEWNGLGEGDPALDMSGFKKAGMAFDSLYISDLQQHRIGKGAFLLADHWFPAAHIDYYMARPAGLPFIAAGNLTDIHHYAWLNQYRPPLQKGDDAYYIAVSNYFRPPPDQLVKRFARVWPPMVIRQYRGGVAVRNFLVYRLTGCTQSLPADGIIN